MRRVQAGLEGSNADSRVRVVEDKMWNKDGQLRTRGRACTSHGIGSQKGGINRD